MLTRRQALGSIAVSPLALGAMSRAHAAPPASSAAVAQAVAIAQTLVAPSGSPDDVARDETFWTRVQQAFTIDRTHINLNNGGVSPSPAIVQEAMKRHLDFANTTPPPEQTEDQIWRGIVIQTGIVYGMLAIYPLLLGVFLSRKKIDDEVAEWR